MNKKQQRNLSIAIVLLVLGYVFYLSYRKNRSVSEQALNEATQSNSVQEMLANTSPVQQNVSQSSTR